MTEEEMRIAVAEWMGWDIPTPEQAASEGIKPLHGRAPRGKGEFWDDNCEEEIPNYPEDLNAVHEAERNLTNAQRRFYVDALVNVHPLHYNPLELDADDGRMRVFLIASMTAGQRTEALLKTIGKWRE